mgnify:CR=1 FL=1
MRRRLRLPVRLEAEESSPAQLEQYRRARVLPSGAVRLVSDNHPTRTDAGLLDKLAAAADRVGATHRPMVSGAGHDACWINRVAPTVMIMCPCVDGLSHNEAEEITPEWAAAGANVLLNAVLEVAGSAD